MPDNPFEGFTGSQQKEAPKKAEPKPKEEPSPRKSTGFASRGKQVSADDYPQRSNPTWDDFPSDEYEQLTDFSDLSQVNHRLNTLRSRFYQINKQLKLAQRSLAQAKAEHSSKLRREMVNISGGTEKTRVAMAEIACEEWESDVIVYNQLVQEMTNDQRIVSKDLDVLETLSNNIRAQIKIM